MKLRKDNGTAGLTILLSLVTMLFVIGLIVMIFAIMSGKMADTDSLYQRTASATIGQQAIALTTAGTTPTTVTSLRSPECSLIAIYNDTTLLSNGNVTEISECVFRNNSYYSTWKINYSYTYLADSYGSVSVINETTYALSTVTDWTNIFLVIGAMIVLIIMVIVIMVSIRSSGLVGGDAGQQNVGTA